MPNRVSRVIATTTTNKRLLRDARFAIGIHYSSFTFLTSTLSTTLSEENTMEVILSLF